MSQHPNQPPPDDEDDINRATSSSERTLLGNDVSDNDENELPPSDRSPLTRGSISKSDR